MKSLQQKNMQSIINYALLLLSTCVLSSEHLESKSRFKRNVLKKGSDTSESLIDVMQSLEMNDEFKNLKAVTWNQRDTDKKMKIPVYVRPQSNSESYSFENYKYYSGDNSDIEKEIEKALILKFDSVEKYNTEIEENVLKAFDLFNETNIRFYIIDKTEKDELFENGHPHIRIRYDFPWLDSSYPTSGYSSCQVNHIGALFPQVDITFGCLFEYGSDYHRPGTIAHEFMHALGFIHEHNRPDSGHWLDYDKSTDNLFSFPPSEIVMHTPYDIGSIMHYPSRVVKLKSQFSVAEIHEGQREKLSKLDILEVNDAYPLDFFPVEHDDFSDESGSGESQNNKFEIILDGLCEFRGLTRNGKPHGYGRKVCEPQHSNQTRKYLNVYFGEFFESERHGKGTQIYPNGTLAEGRWNYDEYVVGSGDLVEINEGINYGTSETTMKPTTENFAISEVKMLFIYHPNTIIAACFLLLVFIFILKKATQPSNTGAPNTKKYTEFV